jgi:hypothetical protein
MTEVWTVRGLETYYTVFVIELQSRRVQVVGSTRHPDEAFVVQATRHLTDGVENVLGPDRVLICDRDPKWSGAVVAFLEQEGVRTRQTPVRAPNCNGFVVRFVGSIRRECLDHMIVWSAIGLRRMLTDHVAYYMRARTYLGLDKARRLSGP